MARVTGIGGIFFKANDLDASKQWYQTNLGIDIQQWNGAAFEWRERDQPDRTGATVWSLFAHDSNYFAPSEAPFMINYRVDNLDELLAQLRAAGVTVDEQVADVEYGRYGWIMDPDGNRIELWEPRA